MTRTTPDGEAWPEPTRDSAASRSLISGTAELVEIAPGLGQAQTAGGAHEKLRAKMFFERCNLLADRRLPRPKLAGDRRKAPTFDDAHEYLDAFEPIHPTLLQEVGYHTEEWIVHDPGLIYSGIGVAAAGGYAPSTIIAA